MSDKCATFLKSRHAKTKRKPPKSASSGKWLVGFKLEHYGEKRNKKMKTYKNLYTQIISLENINQAIDKAARGKKHRKSVQKVLQNRAFYAQSVQQ